MSSLVIARYVFTLALHVPDDVVTANTGFSASSVGDSVARQVDEHVRAAALAYFPPLDYFRDKPQAMDPALLALVDELSAYCGAYAQRELRRRLFRAFSNIKVQQMVASTYTMPKVRPRDSNRMARLGAHFAPNGLRVELATRAIEKDVAAGAEETARRRLLQWAEPAFDALHVVDCRLLEGA